MPMTVTTAETVNIRLLNSSSRISGRSTRRSISTNSAMNTTATTNPPTTVALPHPSSAPWITAYSSANSDDGDGDLARPVERAALRRGRSSGRTPA